MLTFYLSVLETQEQKDKLEFLYESYYSLMLVVAVKRVHNTDIAMDIVHDVILKVIKHIDDIQTDNLLLTRSYLLTMVKNQCIDYGRSKKEISTDDLDGYREVLVDESPAPVDVILQKDGYEKLLSYIDQLSDTYRTVCQLKYLNGLKEHEIAAALDLSPKAVSLRIFRGRNMLKDMIRKGEQHV